jgi:hypothetical protein
MLPTSLGAAWPCQSPAVEPQGHVRVFTATGQDQSDFTDRHVESHEVLFHPAPRSSQQLAGQRGTEFFNELLSEDANRVSPQPDEHVRQHFHNLKT